MTVSAWTKNLKTDEDKSKFLGMLFRARHVFERVLELIDENEKSISFSEVSPKAYDNPNWHYRQAHANGYKQCLRDFKKLFTLDQEELKNGRQPDPRG